MQVVVQEEGNISQKILYLQSLIFKNKTTEFNSRLVEFIDLLTMHPLSGNDTTMFLLKRLLAAYETGDYLLFADLLEYEVKLLFKEQDGE